METAIAEIKDEPMDLALHANDNSSENSHRQRHWNCNLKSEDSLKSTESIKNLATNEIKSENEDDGENSNDSNNSPETSIKLCPIVQLSEGNDFINTSVPDIHITLKNLGYKNPFIYTKMKKKILRKSSRKDNVKWQCMICSDVKSNKKELLEHYELHKLDTEREKIILDSTLNAKWQCMICSDVRTDKDDLLKHYETHKTETETAKASEYRGDYYMCPVCFADFTSLTSYENHVELKHGENQSICNSCNRSFKNLYLLCVHNFNKHTVDKIYRCPCCDFEHDESKELRQHIKEEHEEYVCDICNKGFSSFSWYQEHKNFHVDAIPFQCELCLQNFQYSRYLVAHKKKEHPEVFGDLSVTHECHFCHKKFAHKKSLVSHLRSHTGQSSVLCDLCGKSLSCPDHLKKHLRIHSGDKPHICNVCGKGFSDKSNLKLHVRVHSGEKPHVCNVCNKGFSQRSSLVIHGRLHSGERPYICQLCNKGFVAKGLLGVHIKSCNGMK